MPTGIEPPVVVQYSASAVPVLQISVSSDRLSEAQLYHYGIYHLRQMLAPIRGVTLPIPAGGKYRQIMVDIDQTNLLAKGPTALQVVNAVYAQNLTLPGGDREDRQDRLHRPHQFDAADRKGPQQYPGQLFERCHRLPRGHRSCARRQSGPAERSAGGRQTLGAAQHHQERQRFDIDRCQCGQACARHPAGFTHRHGHPNCCSISRSLSCPRW